MGQHVAPANFKELTEACVAFYAMNRNKMASDCVLKKRAQLSVFVEDFHKQCGTLTPSVQNKIKQLRDGNCIIAMTAHQPNLFAYSGVLRKATLNNVLSKELEDRLSIPVISFFGIADQDFTDDHWVKTALLPDVQRRDAALELRAHLPAKKLLNKAARPSQKALNSWRSDIEEWLESKIRAVQKLCKTLGLETKSVRSETKQNFDGFWKMIEEAQHAARNFADFNAFIISKIANGVWKYDTIFSRFSEFQQVFEDQFDFLLSHFDEYSKHVKEAIDAASIRKGVFEQEHNVIPFWYNCECGSKARLIAAKVNGSLVGQGPCLLCGKEYKIDFGPKERRNIADILANISVRSLSMPLSFFEGLEICCYVGGIGGLGYLRQAEHVARKMHLTFPPIAFWRPRDVYTGLAQLESLLTFRRISKTFDLSKLPDTKAAMKQKVIEVQQNVKKIAVLRMETKWKSRATGAKGEETIEKMKTLWRKQLRERTDSNYSVLVNNLRLLENIEKVNNLHPSIIDYAVNIGLELVSEQWSAFLKENGSLTSDVNLKTIFEGIFQVPDQLHNLTLNERGLMEERKSVT